MNMAEPSTFSAAPISPIRGDVRIDEPMAKHVSWRAGGRAARFFKPADLADLRVFLSTLPEDEPMLFVGLGSNLLVRDGGFDGTVVLTTPSLHGLSIDSIDATVVSAGAGVASPHVAKFAAKHGLAGGEWLAGVPGTIGGALAMNAGCYGTETWDQVVDCTTIDRAGVLHLRTKADFEIGYRHVNAKIPLNPLFAKGEAKWDEWFVAARFRFTPGDAAAAQTRIKELLAKRMASQPLDKPNAGSTFRNPPGDFAARLIESCQLKGHVIGGAQVSMKHANFIINAGNATAADIENLIDHMQQTVLDKTGVSLVREVKIVGKTA